MQNRLDSAAGFSDRPHRPGNRAGSHLKKGGLVRFPHFLSDSSGKTALKLIICALSPYLGQEPKMQKAWT